MSTGTEYVALDKRITNNDYRSSRRLTVDSGEDDTLSNGWTWVAAMTVAALFVVSGYLDQQSRTIETSSASPVAKSDASNTAAPQAFVAGVNTADRRPEKGY